MPAHPQTQALLDHGTGMPATHTLPFAQYEARTALMAPAAEIESIRKQTIDGPAGHCQIEAF